MKSLFGILLILCFSFGIYTLVESVLVFSEEDLDYAILILVLGLFLISILIPLKTHYKKLSWNDDFFYLFLMTLSKRRIRKHRSLKQKMREELQDEFKN